MSFTVRGVKADEVHYLGDSVYLALVHGGLVLCLNNGQPWAENEIYLEPETLGSLFRVLAENYSNWRNHPRRRITDG